MTEPIKNRYEFVLFFDVENGNPNGDPDAGNMPRIDPETGYGIVTDVCLKRKVRNYVQIKGKEIFITEGEALNKKTKGKSKVEIMESYYDVRTFGAVLTGFAKENDGQVRGPVQINFAKSIDIISPRDLGISLIQKPDKDNEHTLGRKAIVPYALYRVEGYVSANFAKRTGFSNDDLELFWESLANMFDHDHSAARGKMAARKLVIFKHDSELGNAPAHKLFDLVSATKTAELPRAYSDYEIKIAENPHSNVSLEVRDL
jgi:CRISPR-associated protein Csd2